MRCWPAALLVVACSASARQPQGRIVVALTVDWEGVALAPDGFQAIEALRAKLGGAPLTHFVSSAYATKGSGAGALDAAIARAVRPGDELAVHLHAWRSLARAAGIEPRIAPSFLNGTDDVMTFEADDDVGFDLDLDAYDVPGLRALLGVSRRILEQTGKPVSAAFRAGGYLATPKMLLALGDEGFTVDSSAVDVGQLRGLDDDVWPRRLSEIWPHVAATTQPFMIRGGALEPILELPIAAVVDYATAADLDHVFEVARERLRDDPGRDEFVVLAFHLETASDYAPALADALAKQRDDLVFVTVDQAAELARFALAPPGGSR